MDFCVIFFCGLLGALLPFKRRTEKFHGEIHSKSHDKIPAKSTCVVKNGVGISTLQEEGPDNESPLSIKSQRTRRVRVTYCCWPPRPPLENFWKADCGYCVCISHNAHPASTFELPQCRHCNERLPGPRKGFGVTSGPKHPRPFTHYRFFDPAEVLRSAKPTTGIQNPEPRNSTKKNLSPGPDPKLLKKCSNTTKKITSSTSFRYFEHF